VDSSAEGSQHLTDAGQPPAKKCRFGKWGEVVVEGDEDEDGSQSTAEKKFDSYFKVGKPESADPEQALVSSKSSMFRRLAELAGQVLSIPDTSASSERTFSRAGLIVTEKRKKLGPKRINDLLVIHNYYLVRFSVLNLQTIMNDGAIQSCFGTKIVHSIPHKSV